MPSSVLTRSLKNYHKFKSTLNINKSLHNVSAKNCQTGRTTTSYGKDFLSLVALGKLMLCSLPRKVL